MIKKMAALLIRLPVFFLLLGLPLLKAKAQGSVPKPYMLEPKYKGEKLVSYEYQTHYSFDTRKNDFKQPVVSVEEEGHARFISLKDYVPFQHHFFSNKFVEIKKLIPVTYERTELLIGSMKNKVVGKSITERVIDETTFFDDTKVTYANFVFGYGGTGYTEWAVEYSDSKYFTRIFFNDVFAVDKKVVEFEIPEWLEIDLLEYNFDGYKIEKTEEKKKNGTRIIQYTAQNLQAQKVEDFSPGAAYLLPHILIQVKSFEYKKDKIRAFQSLQDLYDWYNLLYRQCKNDVSSLTQTVSKITAPCKTDEEKIKALYYWVQDNIRYIAFENGYSGYIPAAVQETIVNKYGDCKAMANLLTEMLKLAGFDAHFSWVGTKPFPYKRIPSMCMDNHCVATLYFNKKVYFLDGTEPFSPIGENSPRLQGRSILVEKNKTYEEIILPPGAANEHILKTRAVFNLTGEKLTGKASVGMTGNLRTTFLQYFHELSGKEKAEELRKVLQFGNENVTASNIKTSDLNSRDEGILIEGEIDFSNAVNTISGDMYIGMDFFPKSLSKYYPDEDRQNGYKLSNVETYDDEIILVLPPDKKCIDLPETLEINTPSLGFKGTYKIEGNKLIFRKVLTLKKEIVTKSELTEWKQSLDKIKIFNNIFFAIARK